MSDTKMRWSVRAVDFISRPLSTLWVLCLAAIITGIANLLFAEDPNVGAFGAAVLIAVIVQLTARIKGIPAWPWSGPARTGKRSAGVTRR